MLRKVSTCLLRDLGHVLRLVATRLEGINGRRPQSMEVKHMVELRIVIGSDASGFPLKDAVTRHLQDHPDVSELTDVGAFAQDDPEADPVRAAITVAKHVAAGDADRGLVFCGNGLGVMIAANSVDGVDAVIAHDLFSIRTSITRNRAQVLSMGSEVIGSGPAVELIDEWLRTPMPDPAPQKEVGAGAGAGVGADAQQ